MTAPQIDVVIGAWNAEATIGETLASIAAQSLRPTRVIVVDDGSSDGTTAVALAAGAEVVHRPHLGVAAAQNAGIAASDADLIAFLDADDLWPTGKLAFQMDQIDRGDCDAVLGHVTTFPCPTLPTDQHRLASASPQPGWLTGALLVRRAAFGRVGPFDERLPAGHAIDWFDRARRVGLRFAMPDAVVLLRRIRPGSLSHRSAARDSGYVAMAREAILRRRTHQGMS